MRIIILVLMLSSASVALAQKPIMAGYGVTFKGDTVWMYGSVMFEQKNTRDLYWYQDINDKYWTGGAILWKEMYLGDSHYIGIGKKRLERIVLQNDKYLLTTYYGAPKWVFFIYDRNTMEAVVKHVAHSKSQTQDQKSLDEILNQYFGDCTRALTIIHYSIQGADYKHWDSTKEIMFKDISGPLSNHSTWSHN